MKFYNSKSINLDLIYWYLPIKLVSLSLLIIMLPIYFDKTYFYSNDFYNLHTSCNFTTPNYLFSVLTCVLSIENLSDLHAIIFSFAISFLKDLMFIIIAFKYLNKRFLIIFCILLSLHPYLNLYYLKFTSDIINNLIISFYFYLIFSQKLNAKGIDFIFLISSMMRNSLIFLFVTHYLIKIYVTFFKEKKTKNFKLIFFRSIFFIVLLISSLSIVESNYARKFLFSPNNYELNLTFFLNKFNFGWLFVDYLISIILNTFTHIYLLMGFREQAFTNFLYFFSKDNEYLVFYIVLGSMFFFFHFFGFIYFIKKFIKSYVYLISLIIYIIPNLYLVAHMRYFMCLIPISIFGVCLLVQNFFVKKSKN